MMMANMAQFYVHWIAQHFIANLVFVCSIV